MITVQGEAQLVAGLHAIGDGLGHMDDAQRGTAELLATDARGRAPKRTGTLARSITATPTSVGTPIRYGIPVHFGVPSHNQPAQPFLAQAVAAQLGAVQTVWVREAQALIDRSL